MSNEEQSGALGAKGMSKHAAGSDRGAPAWPARLVDLGQDPDDEVVEGLAFHDLRHWSDPWLRGILHVLVLGRRQDDTDRVWFHHYAW
jgi:hypothetical protein